MEPFSNLRGDAPDEVRRKRRVRILTFVLWWIAFCCLAVSMRTCVALRSGGVWIDRGTPISHADQWHALIGFGCGGVLIGAIAYASRRYW
jgi:hypothetical protein